MPRADAVAELLDIVTALPPTRRLLALRARLSALAAVMASDAPPSRESAAADLRAVQTH